MQLPRPVLLTLAGSSLLACLAVAPAQGLAPASPMHHDSPSRALTRPFAFVRNGGQWPSTVSHRLRHGPATCWFESDGWVLSLVQHGPVRPPEREEGCQRPFAPRIGSVSLRMRFLGASTAGVIGADPLPTRFLYDRDVEVQGFEELRYVALRPGVDAVVRQHEGRLEYDLHLEPGARVEDLIVQAEGVEGLRLLADGRLVMETALGDVMQTKPVSWGVANDGTRRAVASSFRLLGPDRFGFTVEGWDGGTPLVIDPGLTWSSFLGGSNGDEVFGLALDDRDRILITGETTSLNFPTTMGPAFGGQRDAFVSLIDPTQSGAAQLVWSRFLNGIDDDIGFDITHDAASGLCTVVGCTASPGFPTTPNAFQSTLSGTRAAFVAQLDMNGSLLYSTLLGGDGDDRATAVEVDRGFVVVSGFTSSSNFPVTPGAFQQSLAGRFDAFVARLAPMLSPPSQLVASTYLGGTFLEGVVPPFFWWAGNWDLMDLHVSTQGEVTVAGRTLSTDFPTTPNAFQPGFSNGLFGDIFLSRLDPSLGQLVYSTYFGGNHDDFPTYIDVDPSGVITFSGGIYSSDLPVTPGALQASLGGRHDGILALLDPNRLPAQQLVYSTYVGGTGYDWVGDFAVERSSGVLVGYGATETAFLPATPGAFQSSFLGASMGFVMRLLPQGNGTADLHYLSYLGAGSFQAPLYEGGGILALRADGQVVLAGITDNPAFPTTFGAFQTVYGGGPTTWDITLTIMDLLPNHTMPIGASSPPCTPTMYMQVNSDAWRGNPNFQLFCIGAPANAIGFLLFGGPLPPGGPAIQGAVPHVGVLFGALFKTADAQGFASHGLTIPAGLPSPTGIAAQWAWLLPTPCGGATFGASNALEIR